MKTIPQIHIPATDSGWEPISNEEFEKTFVRDTLVTFAAGLLIAAAIITGLFLLADRLVHHISAYQV